MKNLARQFVSDVDFSFLPREMKRELRDSLRVAVKEAVFETGRSPLDVFRSAMYSSLRDIENHPRGELLQRFLRHGPYEKDGKIPLNLMNQRLSDEDTSLAIRFIWSYVINSFKGQLAELLAVRSCLGVVRQARSEGIVPKGTRLYVGDAVAIPRAQGTASAKGADMHVLDVNPVKNTVTVAGVVEVKSYARSLSRILLQVEKHITRCHGGLVVHGVTYPASQVRTGADSSPIRIVVTPSTWKLPRSFGFQDGSEGRVLRVESVSHLAATDSVERPEPSKWRIRLRWSQEMLAAVAYEMTFWYMAKVGEVIYRDGVPKEWKGMTPSEAGKNAAKMVLYFAVLRARSPMESQRAIALYNAYGFGYALGSNFRDATGRREILFPEDLDELLAHGRTKGGCRLV